MDFSDMKISEIEVQDHLEHHGILGQKWGVRRYQNFDGTLTEAGIKRYRRNMKKSERLNRDAEKKTRKAKYAEAHSPYRVHRLTDLGRAYYDFRIRNIATRKSIAGKAQAKADRYSKKIMKRYADVPLSQIQSISDKE